MNTPEKSEPIDLAPQETAAILRRILEAVEKDRRTRATQIVCAVVLSLATMTSAWCAYQAALWSGVQTFRLAAAQKAGRDGAAAKMAALQLRAFDASVGIAWMQARFEGNERQEKFIFDRFRPEMKQAVQAWLKTDPFNNPTGPQGPLQMAEYVQPELEEAKHHDDRFGQEQAAAEHANANSDRYVLLTVLFASVLFFGGIAGTLDSHRVRVAVLAFAIVFFVVTLAVLTSMPLCKE